MHTRGLRHFIKRIPSGRETMPVPIRSLLVVTAFAAALTATAAHAQKKYDPGASDTEIKIGNIMPYSGPASAYSVIGRTESARREPGRKNAICRSPAGVERLRHGAEHRFQSGRLGPGEPKRDCHLRVVAVHTPRG